MGPRDGKCRLLDTVEDGTSGDSGAAARRLLLPIGKTTSALMQRPEVPTKMFRALSKPGLRSFFVCVWGGCLLVANELFPLLKWPLGWYISVCAQASLSSTTELALTPSRG